MGSLAAEARGAEEGATLWPARTCAGCRYDQKQPFQDNVGGSSAPDPRGGPPGRSARRLSRVACFQPDGRNRRTGAGHASDGVVTIGRRSKTECLVDDFEVSRRVRWLRDLLAHQFDNTLVKPACRGAVSGCQFSVCVNCECSAPSRCRGHFVDHSSPSLPPHGPRRAWPVGCIAYMMGPLHKGPQGPNN